MNWVFYIAFFHLGAWVPWTIGSWDGSLEDAVYSMVIPLVCVAIWLKNHHEAGNFAVLESDLEARIERLFSGIERDSKGRPLP